jgi:hypothetical protein
MSGGSYDYRYMQLEMLADDIERDFIRDGKYAGEDWQTGKPVELDRLEDATPEERVQILAEIKSLIVDLRRCARRAKEIEWYQSGDTDATSYLERLAEIE